MNKLKPLEDMYKFHDFHSPPLDEADFDSKENVFQLFCGFEYKIKMLNNEKLQKAYDFTCWSILNG